MLEIGECQGPWARTGAVPSPTMTFSIGMESLDSGSGDDALDSVCSQRTGAAPAAAAAAVPSAPLDIMGSTRKRGRVSASPLSCSIEESEIVLALGSSPSSGGSSSCRPSTALGLGQGDNSVCSGSTLFKNRNSSASPRSDDSEVQLELGTRFTNSLRNLGRNSSFDDVPLSLGLSSSPVEDSANMQEQSHKGGNDYLLALQLQAQAVDEGSSSARWMKFEGLMPALLHGHRQQQQQWQHQEQQEEQQDFPDDPDEYHSSEDMEVSGMGSPTNGTGLSEHSRPLKTCKFTGCEKGARGASGLCIAHGGGRRCEKHGCNKGAEGRTVYCKAHGGGRRCSSLGCTKSAEGRTDYCISHGGGRRCTFQNCGKAARGRTGLCIRHGGGKRCQREGCTKSAEGYTGLCISHGGGRRCQAPDCTKGAQGSTKYCKAHGGGKRCTVPNCGKGAEGSTPLCKAHGGGKRCMFEAGCSKSVHGGTMFCVAHGGGKRCGMPGCNKSARGRTAYCVKHGGGKRCQKEGCSKSAQGSTDFCKAHGGGKRCIWGQEGSPYGPQGVAEPKPCERFARGKLGLCAAHSSAVNAAAAAAAASAAGRAENALPFAPATPGPQQFRFGQQQQQWASGFSLIPSQVDVPAAAAVAAETEGRVHGGGLLALLSRSMTT